MVSTIRKTISINDDIGNISVKQHEHLSRQVELTVMDVDGVEPIRITGCDIRVFVQMHSKGVVLFDGEVNDGDNGVLSFIVPNTVTQYPGSYKAEVWMMDSSDRSQIVTLYFTIEVQESLRDDAAIEATEECSTFITALGRLGRVESKLDEVIDYTSKIVDSDFYVKPFFMSETSGYAAQSMTVIGQSETGYYYLLGFSNQNDNSKSLLMIFDSGTKTIISSREFSFGHANSMGVNNEGMIFVYGGNKVFRFTIESYDELLLTQEEPLLAPEGWNIDGIFSHGGTVYAYGTYHDEICYWKLESWEGVVRIALPEEQPRVSQSWGTDGRFLYILKSNPNAAAVYDFENGDFIRWINIGDFVGGTFTLGEIEAISVADGLKLLSQYFYPDIPGKVKRFWLISDIKPSSDIPPEQQHEYPNAERKLYVSNALKGSVTFRTNNGNLYPNANDQTGAKNYPYPSLEMALYAAMATPNNRSYIVVRDTETDYIIDNLVLNLPSMDITIDCQGKVVFKRLEFLSGNLIILGNATFRQLITSPGTKLSINGGTFSASARLADGESTIAPYILDGALSIINAKYTGGSDDIMIEFQSGVTGVVGFTEGSPCSTNFQQINLVLLNVRNAGRRHRWTNVFTASTQPAIGTEIPTLFDIFDNTEYRIKWRVSSSDPWRITVAHIFGDTTVDLLAIMSGNYIFRKLSFLFKPATKTSASMLKILKCEDYTLTSSGLSITSNTSGDIPSGWNIASIDVLGF